MRKKARWSLLADDVEDAVRAILESDKWKPFIKRQKCTPRLVASCVMAGASNAPWPRRPKVVQLEMKLGGSHGNHN